MPTTASFPETFARLTDLLSERDGVEKTTLENLLDDVDSSGAPLDPKRDIEPEYQRMSYIVVDLNHHLLGFLSPEQTSSAAATTSSSSQTHLRPSIPAMGSMRTRDPEDFEKDKHAVNAARAKESARINADQSAERSRAQIWQRLRVSE